VSFESPNFSRPIAAAFFGDGSLEVGVSFESLNFAALWSLPVVFICEDNSPGALGSAGGGFPTSVTAARELIAIPATFGIAVETVDGRDVDLVYAAAARASIAAARQGAGFPTRCHRTPRHPPLWPGWSRRDRRDGG
jgi:pyruvate dehydrogenase E1 component alpha subunit